MREAADPKARAAALAKTIAMGRAQNADIHPTAAYIAKHPNFRELIANDAVAAEFDRFEAIANRNKRIYQRLGIWSLYAAFITFVALIYNVTIDHLDWPNLHMRENFWARAFLAVVGGAGLAMQIAILVSPLKREWLSARFVAERLRCLKFEAFQYAAANAAKHEEAAQTFTNDALLEDMSFAFARPIAQIRTFKPEEALKEAPAATGGLSGGALQELKDIYLTMRLEYQGGFTSDALMTLKETQRLPVAASEMAFWGGLTFGYIDAIASILSADEVVMTCLHFITLTLFTVSALLFVRERGGAFGAAIERYEEFERSLDVAVVKVKKADTAEAFIEAVREGEEACLRELKTFCKETERSTYLF